MADETDLTTDHSQDQEVQVQEEPFGGISLEDRQKLGAEVDSKYDSWRQPRRQHELQWFINAAYDNGKHTSEAIQSLSTMSDLSKVDRRKKNIANKTWAKGRARHSKFVKSRPKPIVIPFTHERKDRLNAKMTERALDYNYERVGQEQKYNDVLLWAHHTAKGYWAYHWDPTKTAAIKEKDPLTGTVTITDVEAGDIDLEVVSAFEILVPDLRKSRLQDQPEIMRVRVMDIDEVKARYADFAEEIKADSSMASPFEFERQIAHLSGNEAGALASMASETRSPFKGVLIKELYAKPSFKYRKGRMIVVANGIAIKIQDELPHDFYNLENPYPFTEFMDMPQVGRFYTTAFIEQLIPLQRGYNMLRDKLETQIRMNVHPKWLVPKQARVPKGALTNEDGEVVEFQYIPGMPEIKMVTMASIVPDAWRFAQLLKEEFDDISQVYPSFEGKTGAAKSGFQTNLLQEASDNVHSPDARGFELAIVDSALKFRRMMVNGYGEDRLLSFAGKSSIPEVFEFSTKNIDEHAAIRVQVGSGLSQFKAARVQQLLELYEKGLLGDVNDPEVKRRVMSLLDMGGIEEFQERAALDEDMAAMENLDILDGKDIPIPQFYEDHMVHYSVHTSELKSPANKNLDELTKRKMLSHIVLHIKWINPTAAWNLVTQELGLVELVEMGLVKPPLPTPVGEPGTPTTQPAQPQPQPQPGVGMGGPTGV